MSTCVSGKVNFIQNSILVVEKKMPGGGSTELGARLNWEILLDQMCLSINIIAPKIRPLHVNMYC